MSDQAANVAWMGELRERVQAWLRAGEADEEARWNADPERIFQSGFWRPNCSRDYVDLIFAFGLARIGAKGESRRLRPGARAFAAADAEHQFLFAAFSWRIDEADAGRPHAGPLPELLVQYLERMDRLSRYVVDRMRKDSRILEPEVRVNPYRVWAASINKLEGQISNLQEQSSPEAFQREADKLLISPDGSSPDGRSRVGLAILQQCSFARADQVLEAVRNVVSREDHRSDSDWAGAFQGVNAGLPATARFGLRRELLSLTDVVRRWATQNVEELHRFPPLIRSSIGALDAIDGPHGPDAFIGEISRTILGDLSPAEWMTRVTSSELHGVRCLLAVAERWYRFGRDGLADPVIRGAISLLRVLREETEETARVQARMADEIVESLRSASPPILETNIQILLGTRLEHLNSPSTESHDHPAPRYLASIVDGLAPVMRSSLVAHAKMRNQSSEAARVQARLAKEIVQTLRSASRPVAAGHIATLIEAVPQFHASYTTLFHYHTTVLEFAETVCLTAVEVCSNR